VVIFINRKNRALQAPETPEEEEDLAMAEVIIAKQRNGPTDLFKLVFQDQFTRFENAALGSYER
jgi:replicative DNA helicase